MSIRIALYRISTQIGNAALLAMNLRKKDFMDILLDGKKSLAQRFADVDAEIVRQKMKKSTGQWNLSYARLNKIVSTPTFPESLTPLMGKKVS